MERGSEDTEGVRERGSEDRGCKGERESEGVIERGSAGERE